MMSNVQMTGILMLMVLLWWSCSNDVSEINRIVSDEALQGEIMRDVEVLYSDSAVVRVRMKGPVLTRMIDGQHMVEEFPEGVQMWFFGPAGRIDSELRADHGKRDERENRVILKGNVIWESREGDKMETEELIWLQKDELIYSTQFVTITRPDEVIYGYGFETDQAFKKWKIRSPEGRIRLTE